MKHNITEVVVSAGRGYNHPYEAFSNFKQYLQIKAAVGLDVSCVEDYIKTLQDKAEILVEKLKKDTLSKIDKMEKLKEAKWQIEREIDRLDTNNSVPY